MCAEILEAFQAHVKQIKVGNPFQAEYVAVVTVTVCALMSVTAPSRVLRFRKLNTTAS